MREPIIRRDLVGRTYGDITVKSMTSNKSDFGFPIYECHCICGNVEMVPHNVLSLGGKKMCDRCKQIGNDLTGRKFSTVTAIELMHLGNAPYLHKYRCLCDCGNELFYYGYQLRVKQQINSGCPECPSDVRSDSMESYIKENLNLLIQLDKENQENLFRLLINHLDRKGIELLAKTIDEIKT
ncbi:hypothetical protein Elgi_37540 [Paenibacillus elgii]|uniref:hypothetical protein n=1 Tax=Paenibacillus elgii TaxID=189691 RepID=UPI002D7BFF7D|nr:hypothetical protein Elgi_37540 [Paenibacillus elgii]